MEQKLTKNDLKCHIFSKMDLKQSQNAKECNKKLTKNGFEMY